jgi:DNA-binding NarL/FixJ family response regulator
MTKSDQACREPVTVLVVDDNTIYRDGLCDLIAHWDGYKIIGPAGNGAEAMEMYRRNRPDLVLMDVDMPVMAGAEATEMILQEFPEARIVMMSVTRDDPTLLEAIQAGACGYILKEVFSQQLQHLLQGWAAGEKRHGYVEPAE